MCGDVTQKVSEMHKWGSEFCSNGWDINGEVWNFEDDGGGGTQNMATNYICGIVGRDFHVPSWIDVFLIKVQGN